MHSVCAELIHEDGQQTMTKLILALCKSAKAVTEDESE